jgi:hypothetical protein
MLLCGGPADDMAFFELLAADVWSELVRNKDDKIPAGPQAAPDKSAWNPPPKRDKE